MNTKATLRTVVALLACLTLPTCSQDLNTSDTTPTYTITSTSTSLPAPILTPTLVPSIYSSDTPPAVPDDIHKRIEDDLVDFQDSEITIKYFGDEKGKGNDLDNKLADKFSEQKFKESVKITVVVVPPIPSIERRNEYERLFQAQSTDMDVLLLDVIWSSAFAPHLNKNVFNESDLVDHEESSAQNSRVGNSIVALPWFRDFGMLYYRSDLFDTYKIGSEPPKSWAELEEMARTIQAGERQHNPDFWGFVWQGRAYEGLTCDALEWIYSHEQNQPATNTMVDISDDKAQEALQRAHNWIWDIDSISPLAVLNFTEPDATKEFTSGNAAFMRGWPTAINDLNKTSSLAGKYKVAPLPGGPGKGHSVSILGGQQLGVSNYSKHAKIAAEFVRYMTSSDIQFWRAVQGAYMPTIKVHPDKTKPEKTPYPQALQDVALFKGLQEDQKQTPTPATSGNWEPLGKFKDVDFVARPTSPSGANYDAFSAAFYSGINYYLRSKNLRIESFATNLNKRIQRVIKNE